jgi:hypothetical protein
MDRFRSILGLVAGVVMILSAAFHSLLGWKQLRSQLESVHAPADLIHALGAGWNFGGAAMLAFGFIVLASFTHRLRGSSVTLRPAIVIGTTYVAFGAGAMAVNDFDPFFLAFVIPGVLLLIASVARRSA